MIAVHIGDVRTYSKICTSLINRKYLVYVEV